MPDHDIEAAALDWVIRQRDAAFDGWEAFEQWLSADPVHAETYATVALADQDMAALLAAAPKPRSVLAPPLPKQRSRTTPRAWGGAAGAAVAAVLVAIGGTAAWQQRADTYVVETSPGVPRTISLADGTRLQLNGDTRLTFDRNHVRTIAVDRGEVVFAVAHDAARPFEVRVGGATLRDVGTVFNVARTPGLTRVAVAEGAVIFNPDAEAVRLDAGRALTSRDGTGRLELSAVDRASVGAWRTRRLIYDGAPLAEVAADLSRNLGVAISVDDALARRSFRGVIHLGGDADATMAAIGPLLGVRADRDGSGWRLAAAPS